MKVDVEETASYLKTLTIEVPNKTVKAEIEKLYSDIAKTATHPGFRKGRVPRKILEGRFGKSIRQEAIDYILSSSLKTAVDEHKIAPLTEPDLEETKFEDEGPLSFKVRIEVQPAVELGEYKGIELKRVKNIVGDDDVAKVLERFRISNAKYVPVERPVEKGDFLVLDFEASEDGKPLENGRGENFPVEVGSGAFGEDFEGQLVGMAKDEKKRITVDYPEDYSAKDLAGKEIQFDVKIKDIKLRELSELDDDFARDLGEHETLDELKANLKERLEADMKKRIEDFLREQAISKITSESEVEIPPKLKSKVAASVFEEELTKLAQQGANREALTAQREKIAEFAEKEAERQLKLTFVTDEIAKRENLGISDEELNESIEKMLEESEGVGADIRDYFKTERARERYRDQLRVKKILDFIVDGAKIVEVDEAEAKSESTETEDESKGDS